MGETSMVEKVEAALLADLERAPKDGGRHGCLFDGPNPDGDVVIRGHVGLRSLARAAIAAMRDACPLGTITIDCDEKSEPWAAIVLKPAASRRVWASAIDAALSEPERGE